MKTPAPPRRGHGLSSTARRFATYCAPMTSSPSPRTPRRRRLDFRGAQVRHILRADDLEPLAAHPAQVWRVLLGREFLGEFVGDGRTSCWTLGHSMLPAGGNFRLH